MSRRRAIEAAAVQLVGLLGVAALVEGARRIYPPAAFLLAGLLFVAFAVLKSAQLADARRG
jgi:hypothetical protein